MHSNWQAAEPTCASALNQMALWLGGTPGLVATPPKLRMAEAAKMEETCGCCVVVSKVWGQAKRTEWHAVQLLELLNRERL